MAAGSRSSEAAATHVFLTIQIGDPAAHEAAVAAHTRRSEWLAAEGAKYGLGVDSTDNELIDSVYSTDPVWSAKGPIAHSPPPPLVPGDLVIELERAKAPRAVANFVALCTGSKGKAKSNKQAALHYKGVPFHRILPGFMAQGGDVTRKDGSGGESIYGKKFKDEKGGLQGKHDARGVVAMANSGKNSNSSQFYITFGPAPQCDGKHVVIGALVSGWDVLDAIEAAADALPVLIVDSGIADAPSS